MWPADMSDGDRRAVRSAREQVASGTYVPRDAAGNAMMGPHTRSQLMGLANQERG